MAIPSRRSNGSISQKEKKKSGLSHKSSLWSGAIAICILSFFAFYRLLGDAIYDYPKNPELKNISPSTIIVCLAGGRGRIETAYELFAENYGAELFIIGAGPKIHAAALIKSLPSEISSSLPEARFKKVTVENESRNTIENAYAISQLLKNKPEAKEILLITSSYHMKRSLLILASSLPKEVRITPYTPPKELIRKDEWFKTWIGVEITGREIIKYAYAKILLLPYLKSF